MAQNWKKSVLMKKFRRHGFDVVRPILGSLAKGSSLEKQPPIIANSFPKSGTHLLTQILSSLNNPKDWGQFLASSPSITLKENSSSLMAKRINRLLPGEIASAHLYYSSKVSEAIKNNNARHYFIYRDPRDICISEAFYIKDMNKWHKLHKYFSQLNTDAERIDLAINGLPQSSGIIYPNIVERFAKYKAWIDDTNTLCVKYEDFQSDKRESTVRKIIEHNINHTSKKIDVDKATIIALECIKPYKSHTFRTGRTNQWKSIFTSKQKKRFRELGEDLINELKFQPTI